MSTYAPRWRLASWYPGIYTVEVESEPGRVDIDCHDDSECVCDINTELWQDVCDELAHAGFNPPPDADEDWCYPEEAVASLEWRDFDTAPWHVRAAVLAARLKALGTTIIREAP